MCARARMCVCVGVLIVGCELVLGGKSGESKSGRLSFECQRAKLFDLNFATVFNIKCNKSCLIRALSLRLSPFISSFLIMHVIEHTFFSSCPHIFLLRLYSLPTSCWILVSIWISATEIVWVCANRQERAEYESESEYDITYVLST